EPAPCFDTARRSRRRSSTSSACAIGRNQETINRQSRHSRGNMGILVGEREGGSIRRRGGASVTFSICTERGGKINYEMEESCFPLRGMRGMEHEPFAAIRVSASVRFPDRPCLRGRREEGRPEAAEGRGKEGCGEQTHQSRRDRRRAGSRRADQELDPRQG